VVANCKASQFAYPPPVTTETSTQASKVPIAVLSTTNRARQKAKKKEAAKTGKSPAKPTASQPGKAWLGGGGGPSNM